VAEIEYDGDGQRIAQTDGSGTWSWHWDSLHRLSSVTEGNSGAVSYSYSLRGLPTQMSYPNGKTVSRAYGDAARLQTITDWRHETTSLAHDADGNMIREAMPAGVVDTFAFDRADPMLETSDNQRSN
jgi:YD repeat-containing protein